MYKLEHLIGKKWNFVSEWTNPELAWQSLGGDNYNYRVVDENGTVYKQNTGIF